MHKIVEYDGKQQKMVCNAILPRLYRFNFGKDLVMEMRCFSDAYKKDPETVDFEVLENLTWLMLKEGGSEVAETPEEWLRSIADPVAIYLLEGEAMELWQKGQAITARPKKK